MAVVASIIIPVYNNWDFTRKCLKSVAANTNDIEVIVVDNASSDSTSKGAPVLGKQLFGDNFRYIRNEQNRNFAGASNQGADAAQGEYLVFLNNDTEVQANWLPPLLKDFEDFPNIAATGPLLLYPQETPVGKLVQHLGVYMSPSFRLGHLYQGIPAESSLAHVRRFFQAITAACMIMPKKVFLEAGGFDERYINGFEDVDLCAKLYHRGYRFTVNPDAVVIHHESQTQGRHEYEEHNSALLSDGSINLISPDWHIHLKKDGLVPTLNDWLLYQPRIAEKYEARFNAHIDNMDLKQLSDLLLAYPYWDMGWKKFMDSSELHEKEAIAKIRLKLFPDPFITFDIWKMSCAIGDKEFAQTCMGRMSTFTDPPAYLFEQASGFAKIYDKFKMPDMVAALTRWIDQYEKFNNKIYPAYARDYLFMAKNESQLLHPQDIVLYNIWRRGKETALNVQEEENAVRFSILMPVWNPKLEHLKTAIDSILAQTFQNWELCIVDDASTDPQVIPCIRQYSEKDPRINFMIRSINGGISEATNTCLDMARNEWCAFVDQDDILDKNALALMAQAIAENPNARLLYSDEDKTFDGVVFFNPYLKNGHYDPDLLLCQNYICHLTVCNTERLRKVRFRKEFDGAQDHDMLLRFTDGLDDSQIVHVPHVLYHWRVHEKSTAGGVKNKEYAAPAGRKAASEFLHNHISGGYVESDAGLAWNRPYLPVPESRPLAAIVASLDPSSAEKFISSAGYPLTVVNSVDDLPDDAAITGFVDPDINWISENWLAELVAALWRPGIGAVGGAVLDRHEYLLDAGWMFDISGKLKPILSGATTERTVWFGWNQLARTVDAINGRFFFTKTAIIRDLGSFDPKSPWGAQDFCLKAKQKNLRTVWWPFASISIFRASFARRDASFDNKWDNFLSPFNKNLAIAGSGFSLNV